MRLGEMLLAEGLIAKDGQEEALESQVVHGGRLGTNLVELGLLSERDLVRTLGKQHGVAFAVGEMKPDAVALEMVNPRFADDKDLLPMRVDATRLTLAVINPHDFQSLDSIAFKTGKRVVPVVVAEFRMNQLLRRHCKAFRPMRSIDVGVTRPSRSRPAPTCETEPERAAPVPASPELIDEEEFEKVYSRALGGGMDPQESGLSETGAPPRAVPPSPGAVVSVPRPSDSAASDAPAPRRVPALVPISFAQAQQQLAVVSGREEIARTILRFAYGKWKRALVLSVQGTLVTGWQGVGEGVTPETVSQIGIQLSADTPFRLVCSTSSHYVGPMKPNATLARFYQSLGGGYPTTSVLLPLLVRGRVVHVLYLDNGPGKITPPDVAELMILAQNVARSYEALIRQRQTSA